MGPIDRSGFDAALARSLKRPDQKIEHPIYQLTMVRTKLKLAKKSIHMFLADMDMRTSD